MCASALFAGLTESECREIASCATARRFAADEILFNQGQSVNNTMLINSGSVKLTQVSSSGDEVILWMTGRNDAVGLSLDPKTCRHTCSARAMERCQALSWEYSRMQRILDDYPQIRVNINRILSSRLSEMEERFREIATERVAKRLALTLLRLMKAVGTPHNAGTQVALSREEMAQMTGTTLFTISRILSKWDLEGLVQANRKAVVVRNPRMLESRGDSE